VSGARSIITRSRRVIVERIFDALVFKEDVALELEKQFAPGVTNRQIAIALTIKEPQT